jgi:hypothetical protein
MATEAIMVKLVRVAVAMVNLRIWKFPRIDPAL